MVQAKVIKKKILSKLLCICCIFFHDSFIFIYKIDYYLVSELLQYIFHIFVEIRQYLSICFCQSFYMIFRHSNIASDVNSFLFQFIIFILIILMVRI